MKYLNIPLSLFFLFSFIISCEKDDSTDKEDIKSKFRIKMIMEYENDIPVDKTLYTYENDRIDSVKYYTNVFTDYIFSLNTVSTYQYSGNTIYKKKKTFAGELITDEGEVELEYNGDLLIRYNDVEYTYEEGLLTESNNELQNNRCTYEYQNEKLVRISSYHFDNVELEYIPEYKTEFTFKDDSIISVRYYYNLKNQSWNPANEYKYYYINELLVSREYFIIQYEDVISIYKRSYDYNEKDDLIQETYYDYQSETSSIAYHTLKYDEYDNITEVSTSYSDDDDTRKLIYFYEVGGTNKELLKRPVEPMILYDPLKMYVYE